MIQTMNTKNPYLDLIPMEYIHGNFFKEGLNEWVDEIIADDGIWNLDDNLDGYILKDFDMIFSHSHAKISNLDEFWKEYISEVKKLAEYKNAVIKCKTSLINRDFE